MYFFIVIVLILLVLDNYVNNNVKIYVNKKYKKTLNILNKTNPFYKLEEKHSKNSFMVRASVLALFWLVINVSLIILNEFKSIDDIDNETLNLLENIDSYKYFIFIVLGLFVYFFLNIYSKNNMYFRTADMIIGIIPTFFITFIST
jgi:hypothetical protein